MVPQRSGKTAPHSRCGLTGGRTAPVIRIAAGRALPPPHATVRPCRYRRRRAERRVAGKCFFRPSSMRVPMRNLGPASLPLIREARACVPSHVAPESCARRFTASTRLARRSAPTQPEASKHLFCTMSVERGARSGKAAPSATRDRPGGRAPRDMILPIVRLCPTGLVDTARPEFRAAPGQIVCAGSACQDGHPVG